MKKRDFYQYATGPTESFSQLSQCSEEIKQFEEKNDSLGYNAKKFGDEQMIVNSVRQVVVIKDEIKVMEESWDHIQTCLKIFDGYMKQKWVETKPFDMDEEIKKLQKKMKEIKIDKKCSAYNGIMDVIKKWIQFLQVITELRDDAMRERHWDALKKTIKQDFTVDDKLILKDVFDLNLGKF